MKTRLSRVLATAAAFTFGTFAYAQYGPRGMYEPREVSALVDRVHTDLNRAYGGWHFSNGDRHRLDHAEHELQDFARQWSRRHFDKGELDEAISSIQHVIDNNRMPQGDREALFSDVEQLRGMRESYDRHDIGYGGRY